MKKNIIFSIALFLCCLVVIWLVLILAGSGSAVWVPPVSGYDPNVDVPRTVIMVMEVTV